VTRAMEHWLRTEHTAFCPGCGHGILMGCVIRAVDELKIDRKKLLFVSGIGCAAWIPSPNIRADTLHTLHGRAVAYATGAKLANSKLTVIGNHLIHAARRNIDLCVICGNNQIYGMTGGQTASSTPVGAKTATDPKGNLYRPFDLCAVVRAAGAPYAARWPVTRPMSLVESIKKAITTRGFGFVEAISPCPTQFGRRNRLDDLMALYDYLGGLCVTREEARKMKPERLWERFVIGEYHD
jgi:2-oxoglutarate ferredoxin oxidoreductase subunit beta